MAEDVKRGARKALLPMAIRRLARRVREAAILKMMFLAQMYGAICDLNRKDVK
jgi:hypothetical protein